MAYVTFVTISLLKSTATIGGLTMVSRVLGFLRDILVANFLGAGMLSDVFFVAFKLPNFFRRLFAEGAFSAGFVPLFAGKLTEGDGHARRFAGEALSVLAAALLVLVAVVMVAMPLFIGLVAPGFSEDPQKFGLAVELTRITFPYLFFISMVALFGGVLNSLERYAAFAAAPIFLNICLIAAIYLLSPFTPTAAHALSWGVFLAGLVQLLWMLWHAKRAGWLPSIPRPRLTPDVKRLLKLMGPAALGSGVQQVNVLVDTIIASLMAGAVSWLYYADRMIELPVGVIGIAVATALLPTMAKQIRRGDEAASRASLNRGLELALLLGLPAAAALIVMPMPIVTAIYEHGAFTAADAAAVSAAIIAYAAGLPAFLCIKMFAPAYFARQDTLTPVKIAIVAVIGHLIINLLVWRSLGHVGLAMSTSIAAWGNALALGIVLYRRGHFAPDPLLKRRVTGCLLACLFMGACLLLAMRLLGLGAIPGLSGEILLLTALIGIGAVAYALALQLQHTIRLADVKALLKK